MINIEKHDDIIELNITRPPVNAFNHDVIRDLREKITHYQSGDENTSAIILSGLPGVFTAGLDLPSLIELNQQQMELFWQDFYGLWKAIALSDIPIVAAITGHSPAGGTVLSVFCDYRIMAEGKYTIGLNEVQVGLVAPAPVFKALSRLCGGRVAERHLLAGDLINPQQALDIGMVDQLTTLDQVVPEAIKWCRQHLQLPNSAMLTTRRLARADVHAIFIEDDDGSDFLKLWFSDETQSVLRTVIAKLGKK